MDFLNFVEFQVAFKRRFIDDVNLTEIVSVDLFSVSRYHCMIILNCMCSEN